MLHDLVEPSSINCHKGAGWYSRSLGSQVASDAPLELHTRKRRLWLPSIDGLAPTVTSQWRPWVELEGPYG